MNTRKNNKAVTGILIVVFLSFVLLMIFASYTMKSLNGGIDSFSTKGPSQGKSVAVVEVNGVIMDSKATIELIHEAERDKETKVIFIRINSPGGAVGPTQEIYQEIRRIDDLYENSKGEEGKPVYASFGTIAASGGYYLGAATRKIWTNPGTITGSIGVIMQFMDLSKLYKFAMLNPETIKSGRYKDIGQPNRAITDEEQELLEGMISGVHEQFIRDIVLTRKKKIKGDIKEIAQGQIYSGEQAYNLGLVDELGSLWQGAKAVHDELKIKEKFGLKFIEKKKKSGVWNLLENLEEVSTTLKLLINKMDTQVAAPTLMFK